MNDRLNGGANDPSPSRSGLERLELVVPPVVVAVILLVGMRLAAGLGPSLPGAGPDGSGLADAVGLVLIAVGVLLAAAGVWQFRLHRTTVDPMHPDRAESLVEAGVFRYSRNPMYVGFVAILVGAAWQLGAWIALVGPVVLAAWLHRFQVLPEERMLRRRFGAAFDAYCRRVPRWIGLRRVD